MRSVILKSCLLLISLSIWALALPQVKGQELLNTADSERIAHFLDSDHSPDLLHCSIQLQRPTLDFAFRLDVSYIVDCHFSIFEGHASKVLIVVRVTPEGGKSTLLGEPYYLPEPNKDNELKQVVEMSGGFAVGEGRYQVEVLVADQRTRRTSRKRWSTHVARRANQGATLVSVPPGTVIPMGDRPLPIKMDTSGKGLRLTVLLDAAPLNPRSPSLRAEDRAFLLGSLSSLLKQIPCASVRLRAFNLDQQRELFAQDQFDDAGFIKLAGSLRDMELGTVSAQVLQQHRGGLEMLLEYANQELMSADPSDVVIILGPHTRYLTEIPRGMLKGRETPNPHFCYFEYFPGSFRGVGSSDALRQPLGASRRGAFRGSALPDTLSSLTRRLDGTVYEISSPADLASSIHKMLARVQPRAEPPTVGDWPVRPAPLN
jgi:hypothetical protein